MCMGNHMTPGLVGFIMKENAFIVEGQLVLAEYQQLLLAGTTSRLLDPGIS